MAVHLLAERQVRAEALLGRVIGPVAVDGQRIGHGGASGAASQPAGATRVASAAAGRDGRPRATSARCPVGSEALAVS